MKYAVKDLEGVLLDVAVAKVDGQRVLFHGKDVFWADMRGSCGGQHEQWPDSYHPSTNWALAGPLIEREAIGFRPISDATWEAENYITGTTARGSTPLVAAMRCFVTSSYGDEVELP